MLRLPSDNLANLRKDYPDAILVVIGTESLQPYLSCSVRLIRCEAAIFSRLVSDISSILKFQGEDHRLQLARPGDAFGVFENELRASDTLTFSPDLRSVEV